MGLWRTVDIVVGIAIALAFSFALPLYATWSWRHRNAQALRGCARLYAGIVGGAASAEDELAAVSALGAELVQIRPLLPWVARETHIAPQQMEEIQSGVRSCISILNLMAGLRRRGAATGGERPGESRALAAALLGMARALQFGRTHRLLEAAASPAAPLPPGDYALLTEMFAEEIERLRRIPRSDRRTLEYLTIRL